MVILLAVGVMDLRAMAAVTAAITAERLAFTNRCQAPNSEFTIRCQARNSERVAKAIGTVVIGTGVLLIARAAGR
jgi:predicted metal-binding membrane protein